MKFETTYKTGLLCFAVALCGFSNGYASIIDTDPNCQSNGCAVISYGASNFIIYDNVQADGSSVNAGEPMVPRLTSPGIMNVTGTLSSATEPGLDEGVLLGFTEDGTSVGQPAVDVDMDGFLDAGDTLIGPFNVNATTDIILDPRSQTYSHSFFITSRNTRMSLRARVTEISFTDDLEQTLAPSDILLTTSVTLRGNDNGFNFGRRASDGGVEFNNTINDLGDLSAVPTTIADFRRRNGIRKRNAGLDEQSIRLDFLYTLPDYDFSMGMGSMTVRLEFELFHEGNGNGGGNGNGNGNGGGNNGNGNGNNNTECSDTGNNGNSGNTCNNGNTGQNGNNGNG